MLGPQGGLLPPVPPPPVPADAEPKPGPILPASRWPEPAPTDPPFPPLPDCKPDPLAPCVDVLLREIPPTVAFGVHGPPPPPVPKDGGGGGPGGPEPPDHVRPSAVFAGPPWPLIMMPEPAPVPAFSRTIPDGPSGGLTPPARPSTGNWDGNLAAVIHGWAAASLSSAEKSNTQSGSMNS